MANEQADQLKKRGLRFSVSAISNCRYSAQPLHDLFEGFLPGTEALQRQRCERLIAHIQLREEVVAIGLDIDETGGELAAPRRLVEALQRVDLVGRIVGLLELLQ